MQEVMKRFGYFMKSNKIQEKDKLFPLFVKQYTYFIVKASNCSYHSNDTSILIILEVRRSIKAGEILKIHKYSKFIENK